MTNIFKYVNCHAWCHWAIAAGSWAAFVGAYEFLNTVIR